jgi:hypothetical protein
MNLQRKISCFVFSFFTFICQSQEMKLSGYITSTTNQPIPNASLIVYLQDKIVAYTYSKVNGAYQINFNITDKNTSIKIVANSLGYTQQEKIITTTTESALVVDFSLNEKVEQLKEVVLEGWEKIKIKRDTIVFRASAFADGTENVVEDLLKNIPGIEITSEGIIKVNGKAIDKLLIEGDDLFDDKYKLLSKNLDAKNIEAVEVLNNFEDNPVLKSFQDSDKVAINLKLKANKKNIWFGNIDVGLGTNYRYNSSANIGILNEKIKLFNLTNANSIGNTAVSQVENSQTVTITGVSADKKIEKDNNELVNIDNLSSSNFSNNEDVFNNSFLNSLSFVTNLSKQTKLRSLTYIVIDQIEKENNNFSTFFIEPEIINFTEQNRIKIKDVSFGTELELKHFSKSKTYYTYDFTFEYNPTKTRGYLIFNDEPINQLLNDEKINFFNHLNTSKKISNQTLFLTYTYFGVNNTSQNFTLQPSNFSSILDTTDEVGVAQKSSSPNQYYGFITELLTKNEKIDYGVELAATVDKDKIETDFRINNQQLVDSLSNATEFKNSKLALNSTFNYNISKKLKINSSLVLSLNNLQLSGKNENLFFANPKISFQARKTKIGNFGLGYSYQNNLPRVNFLTNNFILINYRTFNRGLDAIQQTNTNSFTFFYTFSDFKNQFLINSFLLHSYSDKRYGLNTSVNDRVNLNQYEIIEGGKLTNYNLGVTRFIKSISSTIKLSTNQSWTTTPIIINNFISETVNYNSNYRLQGTTYFKLPINFKGGLQYNYSKGEFDSQISTNNYLQMNLDATFKLSEFWLFKFENRFYSINSNNYWFSDAQVLYNPKDSRFSYRLAAKNMSDINQFQDVFISEFQRNDTNYRIMPGFVILNVKYRF